MFIFNTQGNFDTGPLTEIKCGISQLLATDYSQGMIPLNAQYIH